jgi:DNA-binding beta-propeller fold protein YncE
MLPRIKFALLAGILLGSTALTVDARGGTLRNGEHLRHSWISQSAYQRSKSTGLVFVSDQTNHVIDIFSATNPSSPIGQIEGLLSLPGVLAIDKSNNLYAYDARINQIYEFKPPYTGGPVKTFFGMEGGIPSLSVDASGTLYLGTAGNQAAEFVHGQTKVKLINLPVTPRGVTIDASGNLICSYDGSGASGILRMSKGQVVPTNLLIPLETSAADIAFDNTGNLVAEDLDGAYINVYAPGKTKPSKTFTGFINPSHMVFDATYQKLYVSDFGSNTVKVLSYPSGTVEAQFSGFGSAQGVAVSPAAIR